MDAVVGLVLHQLSLQTSSVFILVSEFKRPVQCFRLKACLAALAAQNVWSKSLKGCDIRASTKALPFLCFKS